MPCQVPSLEANRGRLFVQLLRARIAPREDPASGRPKSFSGNPAWAYAGRSLLGQERRHRASKQLQRRRNAAALECFVLS